MPSIAMAGRVEPASPVIDRINSVKWQAIATELNEHGCAVLSKVLSMDECRALADSYDTEALFRSRVVMSRHGFGRGEYKYFAYPLPAVVADLRGALYPRLAAIANAWHEALGVDT